MGVEIEVNANSAPNLVGVGAELGNDFLSKTFVISLINQLCCFFGIV